MISPVSSSVSPKHAPKSCQMLQLLAVETVEDHTSPYPDGTTLTSRRSKIQRWSLWSNCWSKYPWGPTNLCLWCGCVITCSGTRSFGQLLVWNCSGNWWWLGPVISGKKPFCLVFPRVLFPCKRLFRIYFFKSRLFWGEGEKSRSQILCSPDFFLSDVTWVIHPCSLTGSAPENRWFAWNTTILSFWGLL